jgi:hypothetical protein
LSAFGRLPRPARPVLVAACCLMVYALGDIEVSGLFGLNGSPSSWEAVSCFAAYAAAIVLLGSLIPLSLLLKRRAGNRSQAERQPLITADDYGITIHFGNIREWLADHPPHLLRRIGWLGYQGGRLIGMFTRWLL